MFTLQLTASDIVLASYERYANSLPTIQKRMEVLLLVHYSHSNYSLIATIADSVHCVMSVFLCFNLLAHRRHGLNPQWNWDLCNYLKISLIIR